MDPALRATIAKLWDDALPTARSRVETLEAYAAALSEGQDVHALQAPAATAAHQLSGALGSYLQPGSDEATRLEVLLDPGAAAPSAQEVVPLVAALRSVVGR